MVMQALNPEDRIIGVTGRRRVSSRWRVVAGAALTYAEDNAQDDEGVHHRKQGRGDGGDHLRQLLHTPEQPHDPERPHQPNQPVWNVGRPEVDQGHDDDEEVEPIPTVASKSADPVGKKIDSELNGEDDGEKIVDAGNKSSEFRRAIAFVLSIQHAYTEILITSE